MPVPTRRAPASTVGPDGQASVAIQYTDADEWYTLTGSPVPMPPGGLASLHQKVLERVQQGGGAEVPR
ncbi:hypothetical protein [Streptomyces sp. NPDC002845]